MDSRITSNWWALGLRGLAAILLGIACFALTGMALVVLIALFAAYLIVDGIFALAAGARSRSWWLGLEGVVGIVAGGLATFFPGLTAVALAILIAAWALVTGVFEIAAAIAIRRVVRNEWMLAVGGVLSIVFGLLMAIFPGAGLVAIIWLIGAYAIVWGVLLIALAFRLRSHGAPRMVSA